MRLCFIIEEEYRRDSMPLAAADQLARWGHDVRLLHPRASPTCLSAVARAGSAWFDAFVLKTASDGPGICILEAAAASGIVTINHPRAIRLVRDKAAGAARARAAAIPFPLSYFAVDLAHIDRIPRSHYPLVIKPNNGSSMRHVHRISRPADVYDLAFDPGRDHYFLAQQYVENEGYDIKAYVIGREVFAVRRPSPLHPSLSVAEAQIEVTAELARIAGQVRRVFGLDIFGIDVVPAPHGLVAVDINDFPGFRGVPEAVTLVSRRIARVTRRAAVRHAFSSEARLLLKGLRSFDGKLRAPDRPTAAPPLPGLASTAQRVEQ